MRIAYSFILVSTLVLGCGDDGGGTKSTTDNSTDPTNASTGTGEVLTGTTGDPTTVTPTTGADDTTGVEPTTGPGETTAADDTTGPGETTSDTTGAVTMLNGCDPASAEDHTADAETTVTQTGLEYAPKCIRIAAGSSVKFVSTFASHPLVGGEVVGGVKTPDGASPITMTNMGMEASFTFANAGDFGYYCDIHGGGGMNGAIFVE